MIEEGVLPAPGLERFGTEGRVHQDQLQAREALFLGLEDGHLDLLGGHGGHVARLLAKEELGRSLPLAQRDITEHRQDGGGRDDRSESEETGPVHFSVSSFLISASVSS